MQARLLWPLQVPAQWISAPQGMPCSSACSVLNSEGNIFQCGKEEMAAINSSTAIMTLVSDLNLTVPCSPTQPRNDGGSPFTTGSGGCYYWNSAQPAGNVDCDSVLNAGRIPLCYCVPAFRRHMDSLTALGCMSELLSPYGFRLRVRQLLGCSPKRDSRERGEGEGCGATVCTPHRQAPIPDAWLPVA